MNKVLLRNFSLKHLFQSLTFFTALIVPTFAYSDLPTQYFPANRFDRFYFVWYTMFLVSLEEPSLIADKTDNETIRFPWLRSFHNPVAVRVEIEPDGRAQLFLKVTGGAGGYDAGPLVTNLNKSLTEFEVQRVLEATKFMSACRQPPTEAMFDGAQWIMERKTKIGYCVIDQQSPTEGNMYKAGVLLLGLAGYEASPEDIY